MGAQATLKEYLTAAEAWRALMSRVFAHDLNLYAAEAGIRKIHVHQLRHTFGRMVADETSSLDEVQKAQGHQNRSTTKVYV